VRSLKMDRSLTTECHDKPGPRGGEGKAALVRAEKHVVPSPSTDTEDLWRPLLRRNLKMRTLSAHSAHVFPTSQSRLERNFILSRRRLPRSFSVLGGERCGGMLFPGRSTIRRTGLVRIVRTFFQKTTSSPLEGNIVVGNFGTGKLLMVHRCPLIERRGI
jgi:hypothetical protein